MSRSMSPTSIWCQCNAVVLETNDTSHSLNWCRFSRLRSTLEFSASSRCERFKLSLVLPSRVVLYRNCDMCWCLASENGIVLLRMPGSASTKMTSSVRDDSASRWRHLERQTSDVPVCLTDCLLRKLTFDCVPQLDGFSFSLTVSGSWMC